LPPTPKKKAPVYLLRLRGIQSRGGAVHVVNSFATKLGKTASSDTRIAQGGESAFALAFLKQVVDAQATTGFDRRLRGLDEVRQQLRQALPREPASHCQYQRRSTRKRSSMPT
jgi:NADH-quinone oxidoreductase subunit G